MPSKKNNAMLQKQNALLLNALMQMGKTAIQNGSVASDLSSERGQRTSRRPFELKLRTNFGGLKLTLEITKKVLKNAGMPDVTDIDALRRVFKSDVLAPLKKRVVSISSDKFLDLEGLEAVLPALRKQITDQEMKFYKAFSSTVCDALNQHLEGYDVEYFVFDLIARGVLMARYRAEKDEAELAARKQKKASAGGL